MQKNNKKCTIWMCQWIIMCEVAYYAGTLVSKTHVKARQTTKNT